MDKEGIYKSFQEDYNLILIVPQKSYIISKKPIKLFLKTLFLKGESNISE